MTAMSRTYLKVTAVWAVTLAALYIFQYVFTR
jgi:hypothetical protein